MRDQGQTKPRRWLIAFPFALLPAVGLLTPGCSPLDDPNVPEPIRQRLEPNYKTNYLAYRPSAYDRRQSWPLVVVCPGRFPDSAARQIRDWTQLAERYGFIVVVPTLTTGDGGSVWFDRPDEQAQLSNDRDQILAVVRHVRAGLTVSTDRVFLHGCGRGGRTALFAGLSEPETFRAVSVNEPSFDPAWFTAPDLHVDADQPVLVQHRASGLFTNKETQQCIEWLRSRLANVRVDVMASSRDADAERVVEFYERVIRTSPWLHIHLVPNEHDDPLTVRFKLSGTYRPKKYLWDFGDGDTATVAEPIHRFRRPGVFRTTVTVEGPNHKPLTRTKDVSVPRTAFDAFDATP